MTIADKGYEAEVGTRTGPATPDVTPDHAFRKALHFIGAVASPGRLTLYVIALGMAIQGLLALRVWMQLMGDENRGGLAGAGYDVSTILVAPFRSFEPTTPLKDSGFLEFASLVAIEAYLVATLLALTVLFSARIAMAAERSIVRHRKAASAKKLVPETPGA